MAAATVQVQVAHGISGSPTWASAESPNALTFNRQDDESAGSPVIIPASGNGNYSAYSNYKSLQLNVTVAGTTSITNIRIKKSAGETSGLKLFSLTTPPSSYTQCTGTAGSAGNRPADVTTALASAPDPDTPSGYTVVPAAPSTATIDSGSYATTGTGRFGKLIQLLLGVSRSYAGGPSSAAGLPSLTVVYDEA